MSPGASHNLKGSHLQNAQRSEILLWWFPPRIIEQVNGGDDDGGIPAISTAGKPQPPVSSVGSHTFHNARVMPLMVLDPSNP